jgi:hypothetical protein
MTTTTTAAAPTLQIDRAAFRHVVSEIVAKAKQTLPACTGRVDSAVKLVLAGDVALQADGTARVASQSNGATVYHIVDGECTCKDYPKAPSGWCKHRIAAGLAKRVAARLRAPLDAPATGQAPAPTAAATERSAVAPTADPSPAADAPAGQPAASPTVASPPFPEVPAIVTTTITIDSRRVEVKLCDTDDARLLVRLQAILAQYPAAPASATPQTPPGAHEEPPPCAMHGTTLKESTKVPGTYYCPVKDDATGKYCQMRWPAKATSR